MRKPKPDTTLQNVLSIQKYRVLLHWASSESLVNTTL